jgi:hypothetical protein
MKHANCFFFFLLTTLVACKTENEKDPSSKIVDANSITTSAAYFDEDESEFVEDIPCDTNLMANGDFETMNDTSGYIFNLTLLDLATSSSRWDAYSSIPGWETISGAGIEVQADTVVKATSGQHYVELDCTI